MAKPRIGIIGKGNVGTALSEGLGAKGYDVDTVGNEPERVRDVAKKSDVVILAVPYDERENALNELGDAVDGKVLVDVTNAFRSGESGMEFAHGLDASGAEELQRKAPRATVVKAFNTTFAAAMSSGHSHDAQLSVLVAGDDAKAKETVLGMARQIGFDAVDAGPLKNALWLETLGFLNIELGYGQGMGPLGVRLVRANEAERLRSEGSAGESTAEAT